MLSRLSFQPNARKTRGVSYLIAFFALAVSPVRAQVAGNVPSGNSSSRQLVEKEVKIDEAVLVDFDTVFQRISSDYQVTIVAEGIPLHPVLSAEQKESLRQLVTNPTRLDMAIEQLAGVFDYEVEHPYNRVFLLRKKYTDSADLPCVTYAEIVHALQAIDKIVKPYDDPDQIGFFPPSPSPQERFFNALSPEQQKQANWGISLRDVNEDQRNLAVDAFCHVLLDDKIRWYHQLLSQLLLLTDHKTQFRWMKMGGVSAFGLVGPFGPDGYIWQFPSNNGFTSQVGRGEVLQRSPSSLSLTTQDQTTPTPQDHLLAPGMLANRLPSTKTITEAINGQFLGSAINVHVAVDSAIADKPVCVFGGDRCTADVMIRSLAALYGLQLLVPKANDYTITLPSPRPTQSIDEIAGEVRRIWPLPLARSLQAQTGALEPSEADLAAALSPAELRRSLTPEMQKVREHAQRIAKQEAANKAVDAYYHPAIRRLLALTLSAVPTEQSPAVSVSDLPQEVRRLIAIARLSGHPVQDVDSLEHFEMPTGFGEKDNFSVRASRLGKGMSMSFGNNVPGANGNQTWQFLTFTNPGNSKWRQAPTSETVPSTRLSQ